jgi:hypothetical protein
MATTTGPREASCMPNFAVQRTAGSRCSRPAADRGVRRTEIKDHCVASGGRHRQRGQEIRKMLDQPWQRPWV